MAGTTTTAVGHIVTLDDTPADQPLSVEFITLPTNETLPSDDPQQPENDAFAAAVDALRVLFGADRVALYGDPEMPMAAGAAARELKPPPVPGQRDIFVAVTMPAADSVLSSGRIVAIFQVQMNLRLGDVRMRLFIDPREETEVYSIVTRASIDRAESLIAAAVAEDQASGTAVTLPVKLGLWVYDRATALADVMRDKGYEDIRQYIAMQKDLTGSEGGETPSTELQEESANIESQGLTLAPYNGEDSSHTHALFSAQQEAFRDHYGHLEDKTFDAWLVDVQGPDQGYHQDLFSVAWSIPPIPDAAPGGSESGSAPKPESALAVAGGVLAYDYSHLIPGKAFIYLVFVTRPHRKRGLASALLRASLAKLRERGFRFVTLSVDSDSTTQADRIYLNCGFKPYRSRHLWKKTVIGPATD
ncbi:hypothetical protein HK405_001065 [Cladochytrium tenue]|nr:hypothetical protein HK405_001065 [Cladochytrium tenue]